jgi:hypothetical protein
MGERVRSSARLGTLSYLDVFERQGNSFAAGKR